jgi:hypothetical protein
VRHEATLEDRVSDAKIKLKDARAVRKRAELAGEVEEEMLDDIVAAEDSLERVVTTLTTFRRKK